MSSEDELRWHLSVVPYFFVLAGLILVLWAMRPLMAELSFLTSNAILDDRTLCFGLFSLAKRTLFASAICLALLPIAPVFYEESKSNSDDETDKDFLPPLYLELYYDLCQESDASDGCWSNSDEGEAMENVVFAMHHSTTALWWVFWASICFVIISLFTAQSNQAGRACENIFHLHGLLIIPVIIGLVYSVIMYVNIPDMSSSSSDTNVALNWFMPVTFTYLLVVWLTNQLPKTLLPWARQLQANRQAAIMATHNMAYQMQMQAIQRPQIQQQPMPPQQQVPQGPPQTSGAPNFVPYDPSRKY